MKDTSPTRPLEEGEIQTPDGTRITKEEMKEQLVKGVADEFRRARKEEAYQAPDWIRAASERVVEKLFELDAYFDQMLALQEMMAKKKTGLINKLKGVKHEKEQTK